MSRAYTQAEIQAMFLESVKEIARFWAEVDNQSTEERICGAIFGTLVILDGESAELPGFSVVPRPHEDDKAYHQRNDENWFPNDIDIAGDLHTQFVQKGES